MIILFCVLLVALALCVGAGYVMYLVFKDDNHD
jgi:hypothetical protein